MEMEITSCRNIEKEVRDQVNRVNRIAGLMTRSEEAYVSQAQKNKSTNPQSYSETNNDIQCGNQIRH